MNEDRVLTTAHGQYIAGAWDGVNCSRIKPVCDKVIVLPDEANEVTRGGIIVPTATKENSSTAATSGVLIAVGPQAFAYDSDRLVRWEGERPQPGDRVRFQKYAGEEYVGADGRTYRLMQDRSIGGIEEAAPEFVVEE
jgi:chaperonin GroES